MSPMCQACAKPRLLGILEAGPILFISQERKFRLREMK